MGNEFKRYQKYVVFKIEDVKKYLDPELKRQLVIISETIGIGRANDGKKDNHYVVVNEDEPYAERVWELIRFEVLRKNISDDGRIDFSKYNEEVNLMILKKEVK